MANEPVDVIPCHMISSTSPPFQKGGEVEEYNLSFIIGTSSSSKPMDILYNNDSFTNSTSNSSGTGVGIGLYDHHDIINSSVIESLGKLSIIQTDSLITHPIYLTLTIASILGNLAMLSIILFTPQFRKPANYLIVNLSLSSLLFILSANLRLVENAYELWSYNTFRCRLLAVLHRIPVPMLALTTMIISLDRGRVARNPMTSSSASSSAWKILFIWSFSVVIVFPLFFTRTYDECAPSSHKCSKILLFGHSSFSMIYGITYLMSVHIVPSISLIRESAKTQKLMKFLKLSNTEHFHQQLQFPINRNGHSLSDNRIRLLRNSCLFTTIFLTCWLPYGIFQFPLDLPKEVLPELLELYVRFYFRYVRNICYMQITLTPVVLFALSHDLRMYLARTQCDLRCRVYGRRRRMRLQQRALPTNIEQP